MPSRVLRKLGRRKAVPRAVNQQIDSQPVLHTPKKPVLAITGTKPDKLCSICLGRLDPGTPITFCECGKHFHLACIYEVESCPICGYRFFETEELVDQEAGDIENIAAQEEEHIETVYQCPACGQYVVEDALECKCGAVFDEIEEALYLCPSCGTQVKQDAASCHKCGTAFET